MKPATREAAFDLVAEIIDRGLRRREQRSSAKRRDVTAARDAAALEQAS